MPLLLVCVATISMTLGSCWGESECFQRPLNVQNWTDMEVQMSTIGPDGEKGEWTMPPLPNSPVDIISYNMCDDVDHDESTIVFEVDGEVFAEIGPPIDQPPATCYLTEDGVAREVDVDGYFPEDTSTDPDTSVSTTEPPGTVSLPD